MDKVSEKALNLPLKALLSPWIHPAIIEDLLSLRNIDFFYFFYIGFIPRATWILNRLLNPGQRQWIPQTPHLVHKTAAKTSFCCYYFTFFEGIRHFSVFFFFLLTSTSQDSLGWTDCSSSWHRKSVWFMRRTIPSYGQDTRMLPNIILIINTIILIN